MSDTPPLETEVEEMDCTVGGALCEESPESTSAATDDESVEQNTENMLPFESLAVELIEGQDSGDQSEMKIDNDENGIADKSGECVQTEVCSGSFLAENDTVDESSEGMHIADEGVDSINVSQIPTHINKEISSKSIISSTAERDENDVERVEENLLPFESLAVELVESPENVASPKADDTNSATDESNHEIEDHIKTTASIETPQISVDNTDATSSTDSKISTAESASKSGNKSESEIDPSSIYDPSIVIKDELMEPDYKELQKTYIEDFIYSNAPATFAATSEPTSEESKGTPLSRFSRIVQEVGRSDYETLQILYQLLYQRSAWDTQEILIQRILEFSGFNFSKNSEEYFNREMMLRTQTDSVLMKIGTVLTNKPIKNPALYGGEARHELISSIMNFLSKPKRRNRVSAKPDEENSKTELTEAIEKCGCRSYCLGKFTKDEQKRLLEHVTQMKKSVFDNYLISSMHLKRIERAPGPSQKKLRSLVYTYKVKFENKEVQVCKGAYCILHGIKMSRVGQLQKKLKAREKTTSKSKSKDLSPVLDDVQDEKVVVTPENENIDIKEVEKKSSRKSANPRKISNAGPLCSKPQMTNEELSREVEEEIKKSIAFQKVPKVVLEKCDLTSMGVKFTQKKGENIISKDEGSKKSPAKVKETSVQQKLKDIPMESKESSKAKESSVHKLKNFSLVVKSIESAPEELLIDIHFLLFLNSADVSKVKDNILDFSGFSFEHDTEEYDERNEFLQRMSNKIVSEVARSFSLGILSNKEETIKNILSFLTKPDESYLRVSGSGPAILSDVELDDFEDMSDSDESITCEVVQKKVECIDLISSGEDSDKEDSAKPGGQKSKVQTPKKASQPLSTTTNSVPQSTTPQPASLSQTMNASPSVTPVNASPAVTGTQSDTQSDKIRTLRDFETISKIVNTHPHEYLVDIFDLLYMKKHEPSTLRKDILDFSGFTFEKGTPEYIKRKQLLDRMLYNSVRRIYNTLIHNTTEVKVFSKPTMITEIFQFLFKLPDHDTSVRPPPTAKPVIKPPFLKGCPVVKNTPNAGNASPAAGLPLPNQTGKLSDLKRVFQRVACFPCEYLIDVHKLLFMTDCDSKVIRQNIFGFKGFAFGEDSPEFQQRKMYLEYLTFHSLRKISSVLTTRSVDLRNSTKHELATHLTQVLAEYTNTYIETDAIGTEPINQENQNPPSTSEAASSDPNVENIVVTPILDPSHANPPNIQPDKTQKETASVNNKSPTPEASKSTSETSKRASEASKSASEASKKTPEVSKSTSESPKSTSGPSKSQDTNVKILPKRSNKAQENPPPLAISIVDTRSVRSPTVSTTASPKSRRKRKNPATVREMVSKKPAAKQPKAPPESSQFADINLPEIEQYRQLYNQNLNIYSPSISAMQGMAAFNSPARGPPSFSQLVPQTMGYPMVHPYQQPMQVQSPYQPSQIIGLSPHPSAVMTQVPSKPNEVIVPVECCLNDGTDEPLSKKSKMIGASGERSDTPTKRISSPEDSHFIHNKIRGAMNTEDEEDCDKPLSSLIGHPIDSVLKKHICDIVEQTDLQDITINGVIQKIFNLYPKFDLSYRKEFIKSTLRSILYRLGEQKSPGEKIDSRETCSPDCSVTTTDNRDSSISESPKASLASS